MCHGNCVNSGSRIRRRLKKASDHRGGKGQEQRQRPGAEAGNNIFKFITAQTKML